MRKTSVVLLLLLVAAASAQWHGIKMPWGGSPEVSACVRPLEYWRTNNKYTNNMPWPVQSNSDTATEDKTICTGGESYYQIVIGTQNDAWHNLTRQAIVLFNNMMAGVTIPQDLFANWQTAMNDIQACCVPNSVDCDTSMFALWAEQFTEFNEGRGSIPACTTPPPTPPTPPVVKPNVTVPINETKPIIIQPSPAVNCVRPKSYWIANNKVDNNKPWPANPNGGPEALEDKKLCSIGDTWLVILKSTNTDPFTLLSQEAIVLYLNIRAGAPIPLTTYQTWETVMPMLAECCMDSPLCDTTKFENYRVILAAYNNGQQGVAACPPGSTFVPPQEPVCKIRPACTTPVPLGCTCNITKTKDGACVVIILCSGCVHDWTYYSAHNKYDDNMPWPVNPAAPTVPTEDTRFCPAGPTWINILKTTSDQNVNVMLQKEFIAAALNGLNGASASQDLVDIKFLVFNYLTMQCNNQATTNPNLLQWLQTLRDYNDGKLGVPPCVQPVPGVGGELPPCQCNLQCPSGCTCTAVRDINGCCVSSCRCPVIPPSDCPSTIKCPIGCENVCSTQGGSRCVCRGCVHNATYWGVNNRYDNQMPWPANPEGLPFLENKQFCDAGLTWLEIMRLVPGSDPFIDLQQQVIAAYLNTLSGASISNAAFELWKMAYARLVVCCNAQNATCDLTDVKLWADSLRDYNEGRAGVPTCTPPVFCNMNCPTGCSCGCTMTPSGINRCRCICPPAGCPINNAQCGTGCTAVAYRDSNGECKVQCECPVPDLVCPSAPFACPEGCVRKCFLNELGVQICECICQPADCVCNIPCPFGSQCQCNRDAQGCCKCTCSPPSQNVTVPFDCPEPCRVVFDGQKYACSCPVPAGCNANISIPAGCSVNCTMNATTGQCVCVPSCPSVTPISCPTDCIPVCVNATQCTCLCADRPEPCPCTQTCGFGQLCQCSRSSRGQCSCKCIEVGVKCKPPTQCGPRCISRCVFSNDTCVCSCVCQPPSDVLNCTCDVTCPFECNCSSELVNNTCQSRCMCEPTGPLTCKTCNIKCPLASVCEPYVNENDQCISQCNSYGCVHDASFWADNNMLTNAPWPANPKGFPALEETRFCSLGATYLQILKTPSTNLTMIVAKQVIAAQLNILGFNATMGPELRTLWQNAYNQMVGCCQSTLCDATNFAKWNDTLTQFNEGLLGVQTCPVVCPCVETCPAGCQLVCVPDVVTGQCVCHCECPSPACTFQGTCPAECEKVAFRDASGVCRSECQCPPKECVPVCQCPEGCTTVTFRAPNGTCVSECKCPIPKDCICNIACPAGCNAICRFDDHGKKICDCQCPPPEECVCHEQCAPGCSCVAYRDAKGICKTECRCPAPLECICNIHCGNNSNCVCYKNARGECCCQCVVKPVPDCVCPKDLPPGCSCVCSRGSDGKCTCVPQCPSPECTCTTPCEKDCTCRAYKDHHGKCKQKCVCPPPPTCVCNLNCPPGSKCECSKDASGKCVCECVKPPCKCDVQCPEGCKCIVHSYDGKCVSKCKCEAPTCTCPVDKKCEKGSVCKCNVDSNNKCVCTCVQETCPPHHHCECLTCPEGCKCIEKSHTGCCTQCDCEAPKECLCNIECKAPCNCSCERDYHGQCDCKCNCVKDLKTNALEVCVNPASYYAEKNKLTGMPWPANPDTTPALEDKKFCPTGKTWGSIMRSTGADVIYALSKEVIATYLNVLRGTSISAADWEKWQAAYAELTDCCFDPRFCRTADFESWTTFFHAYNTGLKGVDKCGGK